MRAVSLSSPEVISTLNRYYVPVYLSNEEYREGGAASPAERAELERIHREGYAAKLSVGTVHAFVLDPDGHTRDSLHVAQAFKADLLTAMLKRNVERLGTPPGAPVVRPVEQSHAAFDPRALTFHLVARYLERRGDGYRLIQSAGGDWSAFPAEDWISLGRKEWPRLLPPGKPAAGATWAVAPKVSEKILTHFFPPTENNDVATNRIGRQAMKGTVLSVRNGIAHVRLEGGLSMVHSFYHKEDGRAVEASFVGFMDYKADRSAILSFDLVTEDAVYHNPAGGGQPFGVAVRAYRGK